MVFLTSCAAYLAIYIFNIGSQENGAVFHICACVMYGKTLFWVVNELFFIAINNLT